MLGLFDDLNGAKDFCSNHCDMHPIAKSGTGSSGQDFSTNSRLFTNLLILGPKKCQRSQKNKTEHF